ncbi:hypothetical protein L1987_01950 [Smallanthus sonchifolius]|uniref:Uncharacterized protein n=1 Tax=Smallanthus sonchifolius TaxID=185202 RepID=A0ACB9K6J8_9ASTR|nr:hypothetical protein L1987_01950 [Smallanthus sonchifolius]
MTKMGKLTFFLGLEVKQSYDGTLIHQAKYIQDMLKKFQMTDSKTNPKESLEIAIKRILHYLKGSPKLGLWYPKASSFDLVAYSDSDHGGCQLDRKSVSGGCQYLGHCLVSWQCKKQTSVPISSAEAEYIAASSCCSQILWIQHQIMDYGINLKQTLMFIDNEACVKIVKNPIYHSNTKHIDVRVHAIRDAYEKEYIQVLPVNTNDQKADIFRKAFDKSKFLDLVQKLGSKGESGYTEVHVGRLSIQTTRLQFNDKR